MPLAVALWLLTFSDGSHRGRLPFFLSRTAQHRSHAPRFYGIGLAPVAGPFHAGPVCVSADHQRHHRRLVLLGHLPDVVTRPGIAVIYASGVTVGLLEWRRSQHR